TDLRDESSREGMRIVIDIRRDASASVILNNLYKLTSLAKFIWIQYVGDQAYRRDHRFAGRIFP
ncbi:hypothetical protein CQA20_29405, partial [Klebsiella pneumoniae]